MAQKRTFSFTDRALRGLPIPPKPNQLDYFDTASRGLGLRISYGGRKSFFAMYSNAKGKRQRVSLGEFGRLEAGKLSLTEARKQTKARLALARQERRPRSLGAHAQRRHQADSRYHDATAFHSITSD